MPSPRRSTRTRKQTSQAKAEQSRRSRNRKSNVKRKKTLAKRSAYSMDQLSARFGKVGSRKQPGKNASMGMSSLMTALGDSPGLVRNPFGVSRRSKWVKARSSPAATRRRSKQKKTTKARRHAYSRKRRSMLIAQKKPFKFAAPTFTFNRPGK